MNATYATNVASSIFLAIVFIACFMHLWANFDRHSPTVERWGWTLIGAGALGSAIYPWSKTIENFPIESIMHCGMALIAIGLIRGRVRGWIVNAVGWRRFERRSHGRFTATK